MCSVELCIHRVVLAVLGLAGHRDNASLVLCRCQNCSAAGWSWAELLHKAECIVLVSAQCSVMVCCYLLVF